MDAWNPAHRSGEPSRVISHSTPNRTVIYQLSHRQKGSISGAVATCMRTTARSCKRRAPRGGSPDSDRRIVRPITNERAAGWDAESIARRCLRANAEKISVMQAQARAADPFDQRRSGATPHVSRHGESFFDAASLMANRSLKLRRV
ncbi:hypothetical protein [Lysobacter gummosus]|uniref:hypothetical protein n=1 Tax=Lysobacter gummosus TaxID=262324 RepID=UPI00362D0C4A